MTILKENEKKLFEGRIIGKYCLYSTRCRLSLSIDESLAPIKLLTEMVISAVYKQQYTKPTEFSPDPGIW